MTRGHAPATDAQLVAGVLEGDRDCFAAVYDRYADRLHDFAHSMLRQREQAADCVADSFVTMAEKLPQLRDPDRLRPWLYSIVRRECLRVLRERAKISHDGDERLTAMPDRSLSPADLAESDELQQLVWDASAGLADRDRALLDLHLRQGLDGAELAEAIGATPANTYVMLSRMRTQMERSLGALLVARTGRDQCGDLADVLRGWDGAFTALVRKRVVRHVDHCDSCGERRSAMVRPSALFAAAPVLAAPAALRSRVLDDPRLVSYLSPAESAAGPTSDAPPPDPATERRRSVVAGVLVALLITVGVGTSALLWPAGDSASTAVDTAPELGTPDSEPLVQPGLTITPDPTPDADPTTEASSSETSEPSETSAPAAPALLRASTRLIDFGTRSTRSTVRLVNVGGTTLSYRTRPRVGWLTVSRGTGTLAAGQAVTLQFVVDRSGLGEGESRGDVAIPWDGGTVLVGARLQVDRDPRVGPPEVVGEDCEPTRVVDIAVSLSDHHGIASARIAWQGPGTNGQGQLTRSGDRWRARIGPFPVGGAVTVTVSATDANGNRAQRSRSISVLPCPG